MFEKVGDILDKRIDDEIDAQEAIDMYRWFTEGAWRKGEQQLAKIEVNIVLFASLKEKAGSSPLTEAVEEGTKLEDIWESLKKRFGFQQLGDHVLMARNGDLVPKETIAQNGDTISFFPPVSGG